MKHLSRAAMALAIMIAVAFVVRTVAFLGPSIMYEVRQPSVQSQCEAIHAGTPVEDVTAYVHRRGPPLEESIGPNQLSFGDWDQCQVELSSDHKVINARMLPVVEGSP